MPAIDPKKLGLLLTRLTRDFQKAHDEKVAAHNINGMRASHSAVTTYIANGPARLTELAELNGIRPQSILKIVNELEQLEFVQRIPDPDDSRAKLVQFTPLGKKMLSSSTTASQEIYRDYATIIGEENLQTMLASMEGLLAGLAKADTGN